MPCEKYHQGKENKKYTKWERKEEKEGTFKGGKKVKKKRSMNKDIIWRKTNGNPTILIAFFFFF